MDAVTWAWIPNNLPTLGALGMAFLLGGGYNKTVDALREAFKYSVKMREEGPRANADRPKDVISDVHTIYQIIGDLRATYHASRVTIMRAENGGQIPTIGKELTSSIAYESFADNTESVRDRWQKQSLHGGYVEMLCAVKDTPSGVAYNVDEIKDPVYRIFCKSAGDGTVHLFPVYSTEGAYYYMTVAFREPPSSPAIDHNEGYADDVRVAVKRIADLFAHWHKGKAQR